MYRFIYNFSERVLFACVVAITLTFLSVSAYKNQELQCRNNFLLCNSEQLQKMFDSLKAAKI